MKILPGEQGTEAWRANRRGRPTASCFHRILSPARLKVSDSSFGYVCELAAERLLGVDISPDATAFMDRGKLLEEEAVRYYEFATGLETKRVGLCVRDDGLVGCSPDRLVGDDGGLELKCPSAAVHVGYLLDEIGSKYRLQVQGALWITGRKWWDLLSYCPDLPPALVRLYPEAEVFDALNAVMPVFLETLREAMEKLAPGSAPDLDGHMAAQITEAIAYAQTSKLPQEALPWGK